MLNPENVFLPSKLTSLILNSPYTAPTKHWEFVEKGKPFEQVNHRRKAGYMTADPSAKPHENRGKFVPLPVVNKIRQRVDTWRKADYPGITGITKTLLEHWQDKEQRNHPFFFCQIEAIETLIWFVEAPESEKTGIDVRGDGGEFQRLCCKLATGTGKTVVMAMLIAWQSINRATYPRDGRFSENIFIVAPNLTVRERLAVLSPANPANYYKEFQIVPLSLREKLRRAKVLIRNWHTLNWESEEKINAKHGVDKRGAKSDEAYTREVLGEMASARNFVVINDEAHHAWRVPVGTKKLKDVNKEELDEATKWIGGLDRLHKTRGILSCFDFSATPFASNGRRVAEDGLFPWIISDFGLTDAIEAGIVKTPRVVVRDDALPDAKTYKPKLYHIYTDKEVKEDFNRSAEEHEPLPVLVTSAYTLLGTDWLETKKQWKESGKLTPPVMITVANRTETAARIKYAFDNDNIIIESLCEPDGILHIDSSVLKKAEAQDLESQVADVNNAQKKKRTKKEQGAFLREEVNTVGQEGKSGEQKQNIISVGMLSEGWDARTVTHIMGLRAFSSQLLCEQVVGRGLRRESYEINEESGLFDAEYVNVFGVPFSFLPHEEGPGEPPPPPKPKTVIQPVDEKKKFEIKWPNVMRIDRTYKPRLSVDWDKIDILTLDTDKIVANAEIAPTVNSIPDIANYSDIDLDKIIKKIRRQKLIFKAAQDAWRKMKPDWSAATGSLLAEIVRLAEEFLDSDRIEIIPALFNQDPKRRQLIITLCMPQVFHHFWQAIEFTNTEQTKLVLDENHPIGKTGDMRPWRTGKPNEVARKSHINFCVYDSTWELSEAFELDRNKAVEAWVKNDHLGFDISYVHNGVVRKYRPDFLVRMKSGKILVLETKGQQTEVDKSKQARMKVWTAAVNAHGGFGQWDFKVSRRASDIKDVLAE